MKQASLHPKVSKVVNIINEAAKLKIIHLYTEDETLNGREITVNGQKVVNFGSCSYLGLEMHPKLKQGAIDAIQKYGTNIQVREVMCLRAYIKKLKNS